jgi:hypothetical protein
MLLMNDPGLDDAHTYWPLEHAAWLCAYGVCCNASTRWHFDQRMASVAYALVFVTFLVRDCLDHGSAPDLSEALTSGRPAPWCAAARIAVS